MYRRLCLTLAVMGLFTARLAVAQIKMPAGMPPEMKEHINQYIEDMHKPERPRQFKPQDFSFKNIKFQPKLMKYIEVSGEAQNVSTSDLRTARFKLKIRGKNKQLLVQKDFYLNNFVKGKPVKFNFYLERFDLSQMQDHEISFEEGFYYN